MSSWNFPQGTEPLDTDQEILEEALAEEASQTDESALPEVTEATEVNEPQQMGMSADQADADHQTDGEGVPYALLKVYGKYIPVQTKEELINLAQQGVDYDNKMYKLREWKDVINVVEENKVVQELIRRALKKEDIEEYVSFDGVNTTDINDSKKFKEYLKKQVDKELSPYRAKIDELEKELFFSELRSKDPELFDTVLDLCKKIYMIPEGEPNAIPAGLKTQINEDKEVFKIFYNFIREKVVAYQNNQPQPETPVNFKPGMTKAPDSVPEKQVSQGSQLKRSVRKVPILENGRENISTGTSNLSDAEKIWNMPSSKFQELIKRAESGYKR